MTPHVPHQIPLPLRPISALPTPKPPRPLVPQHHVPPQRLLDLALERAIRTLKPLHRPRGRVLVEHVRLQVILQLGLVVALVTVKPVLRAVLAQHVLLNAVLLRGPVRTLLTLQPLVAVLGVHAAHVRAQVVLAFGAVDAQFTLQPLDLPGGGVFGDDVTLEGLFDGGFVEAVLTLEPEFGGFLFIAVGFVVEEDDGGVAEGVAVFAVEDSMRGRGVSEEVDEEGGLEGAGALVGF